MKTKKFNFRQTVITQEKKQFDYEIEAKSIEEAERKFKKLFLDKVEEGQDFQGIKKLKPKKSKLEIIPVDPEATDSGSVIIEYSNGKKKNVQWKELYNNKEKNWKTPEKAVTEELDEDLVVETLAD